MSVCNTRAFTLVELSKTVSRGFTLVELLVVITIIIVLLALLVPALDKAVYQTELVLCASRLKVIGAGVTHYALDHGRKYPYNPAHDARETWQTNSLRSDQRAHPRQQSPVRTDNDMRKAIRDYIAINQTLNDPLAAPVELEEDPAELVYSNYSLWYGWRWVGGQNGPGKGMNKIGDRFTWNGVWAGGVRTEFSFNLLASDSDINLGNQFRSGHGDHDGKMDNWVRQNVKDPVDDEYSKTLSIWTTRPGKPRGLLDRNIGYQDLSVVRYNHVQMYDDRMLQLPHENNGNVAQQTLQIPAN